MLKSNPIPTRDSWEAKKKKKKTHTKKTKPKTAYVHQDPGEVTLTATRDWA